MRHPIQFISLGPGDPELITVKGLNALRAADIIYCPATQGKQGLLSRAKDIVQSLGIAETSIQLFLVPMSKERAEALKVYDNLFIVAKAEYEEGKRIIIVAEGDAGFYSSIQYIYDRFVANAIPVQRIAGVPAFLAAGACAGIHVVKQEEQLLVIPGIISRRELEEHIREGKVVVLMKLPSCQEAIKECLRNCPDKADYHYFEQVGTGKEYHTSAPSAILGREFPYFSLMIIRPHAFVTAS